MGYIQYMKITPVISLADLAFKARRDSDYADLAARAAENLGGINIKTADAALRWLNLCADETDEDGVVAEINFCI